MHQKVDMEKIFPKLGQKWCKNFRMKRKGSVIENMLVALIGIVMVTAAAAIEAGKGVISDANGKAVDASTKTPVGVAITGTTIADGLIAVKIK